MSRKFNETLPDIVEAISKNYDAEEIFFTKPGFAFPNRDTIISFLNGVRRLFFPGYFGKESPAGANPDYYVGQTLIELEHQLNKEIYAALAYNSDVTQCNQDIQQQTDEICLHFFQALPDIQQLLLKDVQAALDGDPAAHSKEEIIFSYPGLNAIFVYRIAHELYLAKVPFIPRIMTEYAHSRTGIDINAGATIGKYFFMDHGTGIVIGETTCIGNNVKIYQGVTLGALSTRTGQQLCGVKRHPTIEDNVTIYSNASILGGETVIGAGSIIGGNAFVIESVPENTKVIVKNPELSFKTPKKEDESWNWDI